MKSEIIVHRICGAYGSSESSEVKLIANTKTGETELVISKTITERYPITDYEKVMQLHEDLNRGGGRRVWELKDFTK